MSEQYPTQPPYHTPQYAPPQPPKKKSKKWLYIGIGAAVFITIIVAASSNGGEDTDKPSASSAQPAQSAAGKSEATKPKAKAPEASTVDQFKAFVSKHGTATEKAASKHVTKIQGADNKNDILDAPEVYTDYSGDLMSEDAASGKLIASSFADWQASRGKDSKNGLVTVYNKTGELLSNGNY
jgi:hypothetical protein